MYFYLPKPHELKIKPPQTDHFFSMRTKVGDIIYISDQIGWVGKIQITAINKQDRTIRFKIISEEFHNRSRGTNIMFQAITDKQYLEKMIEISPHASVSKIYLFYSDFSPKKPVYLERLQKILIRSTEQSQNPYRPEIILLEVENFKSLIQELKPSVLDCMSKNINSSSLNLESVLVGPEGGWSETENKLFQKLNLPDYNLGSIILPSWLAGYTYFQKFSIF
jgi:16S rRNA (uracil1498-N3)-methyltransferase